MDNLVNVLLVLVSLALLIIPLIGDVLNRDSTKKIWYRLTKYGIIFFVVFIIAAGLGVTKVFMDNSTAEHLKTAVDSTNIRLVEITREKKQSDSISAAKLKVMQDTLNDIRQALRYNHLTYNPVTKEIKHDPSYYDEEMQVKKAFQALLDSIKKEPVNKNNTQTNALGIDEKTRKKILIYWEDQLQTVRTKYVADSAELDNEKQIHLGRMPSKRKSDIQATSKDLEHYRRLVGDYTDSVKRYKK